MKGWAFSFMLLGIVSVLVGMGWGIHMSASGNHAMAPAHAHLNLIGWVGSAIFAMYYHTVPRAGEGMLPKVHFLLAAVTAVAMPVGIAQAVSQSGDALAKGASVLAIVTMLVFLAVVIKSRAA